MLNTYNNKYAGITDEEGESDVIEYLIDGCNFIKFFSENHSKHFEKKKSDFLLRLRSYTRIKRVKVTVVFDSRRLSDERFGRVRVIHARDADRRIAEEVIKRKSPQSVTVVSNDRALITEIQEQGAKDMSVSALDELLEKNVSGNDTDRGASEKPSHDSMSEEDVKRWKRELGL